MFPYFLNIGDNVHFRDLLCNLKTRKIKMYRKTNCICVYVSIHTYVCVPCNIYVNIYNHVICIAKVSDEEELMLGF